MDKSAVTTVHDKLAKKTISFEKHIVNSVENQNAINCLAKRLPEISKQKLKLAMKYGAVWLTSKNQKAIRIRKVKKLLNIGDKLSIYFDETILFSDIKPALLISDEGSYSVWNKPSGMFSQGSKWGDHTSIARWVELFGLKENGLKERPCFLVHRLDRATKGIILVSHSKEMTVKLSQLFEERKVIKKYKAIVTGHFPDTNLPKIISTDIDGRKSLTKVIASKYNQLNNQSTLVIGLETGRKHQIRKHLASIGFPIIGDRLYGNQMIQNESNVDLPDLKLASVSLQFTCPIEGVKREYEI